MARSATTDAAAQRVLECGTRLHLPLRRTYSSLHLYLVQADSMMVGTRRIEGYDDGGTIWVSQNHRDDQWMWAHEFLHAMYGLGGTTPQNHDPAFAACGLLS